MADNNVVLSVGDYDLVLPLWLEQRDLAYWDGPLEGATRPQNTDMKVEGSWINDQGLWVPYRVAGSPQTDYACYRIARRYVRQASTFMECVILLKWFPGASLIPRDTGFEDHPNCRCNPDLDLN